MQFFKINRKKLLELKVTIICWNISIPPVWLHSLAASKGTFSKVHLSDRIAWRLHQVQRPACYCPNQFFSQLCVLLLKLEYFMQLSVCNPEKFKFIYMNLRHTFTSYYKFDISYSIFKIFDRHFLFQRCQRKNEVKVHLINVKQ